METATTQPKKGGNGKLWLIVVIIIVVIAAAFLLLTQTGALNKGGNSNSTSTAPAVSNNPSDYQAVFLNNNQVYFGRISNSMNSQFVTLEDIYYLQVQQQIQPASKNAAPQQNISLVKLGGELHGPTDKMYINRDQVLLVEDLRADSNIVRAIQNYKGQQ